MTDFLDWKYISEDSIRQLEACTQENEIKRFDLSGIMDIPLSC